MKLTRKQLRKLVKEEIENLSYEYKKSTTDDFMAHDDPDSVKTEEDVWAGGQNIHWQFDHLADSGSKEKSVRGIERLKITESKSDINLTRQKLRKLILKEMYDYSIFDQTDSAEEEEDIEQWSSPAEYVPASWSEPGYYESDIIPKGGEYVERSDVPYEFDSFEESELEGGLIVDEEPWVDDYVEPPITGRGQGEWDEDKKNRWRERWPKVWRRSR